MENTAPTTSTVSAKRDLRWFWYACWVVLFVVAGVALYLVLTARPAYYSPAAQVRKNDDYEKKLKPPPVNALATNAPLTPPNVTLTTNNGELRIEYLYSGTVTKEALNFTIHHVDGGALARLGDTAFRLKRIGTAWTPPSTNISYGTTLPARFYGADLKLLPDADVLADLPKTWERQIHCRDNYPNFRFDFEITGGEWKMLTASFYDARTHSTISSGWSGQEWKQGYKYEIGLQMWHSAPVDLMIDVATAPVEVEEIEPRAGASFQAGAARYHLIFTGDDLSGGSYGSSSDGKKTSFHIPLTQPNRPQKECVFIYHCEANAQHKPFELEYLDAAGKKIETAGGGSSSGQIIQGLRGELANVKKIRVRKYLSGHRVIIRLPGLPELPPENQNVDNLFRVRAPMLKFNREYEQAEYIRRITQMDLVHVTTPNFPPGTYPRWFTNATPVEVLEDYATIMGVPGQLYANPEKLAIEKGFRPWPMEAQEKLQKLWKKLRGP
ncbi:MAG: hypothetical protein ACO1QS_07655 [Verrucomicrobiota bacterium]